MSRCFIALATLGILTTTTAALPAAEPQLAHMVFFTLADDTSANRETLVAACQKYLQGHEGTVYFSAGSIADDLNREVNDRDFDVALHLVFADKAAHDTYQTHPRHLEFIEKNKHLWSGVRVFDSYLPAPAHDALPAAAKGFSGMLQGKVVATVDGGIVVDVQEVPRVWRQSKAEEPKALVNKSVLVKAREGADQAARFLALVKVGEALTLDVGNREGDTLVILELTEDQRDRVRE